MKAIKTLLAVSVLAAAGAANALTVATYNVTLDGKAYDEAGSFAAGSWQGNVGTLAGGNAILGTGTAHLDIAGGVWSLTIDWTANIGMDVGNLVGVPGFVINNAVAATSVYYGSADINTHIFSVNDPADIFGAGTLAVNAPNNKGTETFTACSGNRCSNGMLNGGLGVTADYTFGSAGTAGQTPTTMNSMMDTGGMVAFERNFHLAPVPVPAAAWLFGSGLLGLAGTARRRSAS